MTPSIVLGALAVVLRPGKVLLVQRLNDPDAGLWGFPGGRVELGETAIQAALRELTEETGLVAGSGRHIGSTDFIQRDAQGQVTYHCHLVGVLCAEASGEARAGDDAGAVRWVSDEEVLNGQLAMSDGVDRLLRLARAAQAAQ